jgi:hypothetical protein
MDSSEDFDGRDRRIAEIIGDHDDLGVERWLIHLRAKLSLPCEVSGSEDFQWEEPYVLGVYDRTEYHRLRKTQPSYRDVFVLESIEDETDGQWAMFVEDLGGNVRRKSDGKRFLLGLSELRAVDENTPNRQLLEDYSSWLVNYR